MNGKAQSLCEMKSSYGYGDFKNANAPTSQNNYDQVKHFIKPHFNIDIKFVDDNEIKKKSSIFRDN